MQTITLKVSERDYTIILGALREVSVAIEPWELATRVGGSEADIDNLHLRIQEQGERQGAQE